jgi:hypothetical protein
MDDLYETEEERSEDLRRGLIKTGQPITEFERQILGVLKEIREILLAWERSRR